MKVCCVFEENKLALFRNILNKNMLSISLFRSREPKAQVSFIGQNVSVVRRRRHCLLRCRKLFTFSSSSPEPLCQFLPTWHKASFGEGIQFFLNEGPRPFPR